VNSLAQTTTRLAARQSNDTAEGRTLPELNIINHLPHAVNMPQHLASNASKPMTNRHAMLALVVVAAFAIAFL